MRLRTRFPALRPALLGILGILLLCVFTRRMVSSRPVAETTQAPHATGSSYWHTRGNQIVDAEGRAVRIAGINWYGFETSEEVVQGLNSQDYKSILDAIHANGYNTIRIPFSNQMVESPVIPSRAIAFQGPNGPINGDLAGLNSLEILDKIVDHASSIGLRIILDNHRSEAGSSAEANGLWYTSEYPESHWIADWEQLTRRYRNQPAVIGMDLRNEPHNAASGGACWDCGAPGHDWRLAAERAGNAILAINPGLLIFVEGTDGYHGDNAWWGGNLEGVAHSPVRLSISHQLVYSAHVYGPSEYAQRWFNSSTSYATLAALWTSRFAYISQRGIAPVWVGEFGTGNDDADVASSVPGSQGQWFQLMIRFLHANPELSWTYWAVNGADAYALFDRQYRGRPVNADKQSALASIQFPIVRSGPADFSRTADAEGESPSALTPAATPAPPAGNAGVPPTVTPVAAPIRCHVTYLKPTDWHTGFTGSLKIYNNGPAAIQGWTVAWQWAAGQHIIQSWNATFAESGGNVTLTNSAYNQTIPAHSGTVEAGFNASYSGRNPNPAAFYLNGARCE